MLEFALTEIDYGVPGKLRLTEAGRDLASAYEQSIQETTFMRQYRGPSQVPATAIHNLGTMACPCLLHAAGTPALQRERRIVKSRLVREAPTTAHENDSPLWESLHLILNVLKTLSHHGLDRKHHVWRRLLTTGLCALV